MIHTPVRSSSPLFAMRHPLFAVLLLVVFVAGCRASGNTVIPSTEPQASVPVGEEPTTETVEDLEAPLPLDPAVRTGRLENGLVYY
ncbi:MAG: hypothetical protein ACOCTG_06290, partial [Bacteroidota bacterium]